jgi:Xaa-Pro aminopeptidase
MVITIEPGLYIGDDPDIPAELRNIGVRIEDDIVVTESGPVALTGDLPTDATSLEALMMQSRPTA